ncbi:MAG: CsiV family protein [Gammaproteobacteria bacterium]
MDLLRYTIFLIGLTVFGTGFAKAEEEEERWFQIELLAFSLTDQHETSSELWPDDPGNPDVEDAIELLAMPGEDDHPNELEVTPEPETLLFEDSPDELMPNGPQLAPTELTSENIIESVDPSTEPDLQKPLPVPYQLLPESEFTLGSLVSKLESSPKYEVLKHLAWRQPALSKEKAFAIRVSNESVAPDTPALTSEPVLEPVDQMQQPEPVKTGASENPEMYGTIKVVLGRYLHLNVDLIYKIEKQDPVSFNLFEFEQGQINDFQPFRLRESRRMRSGELHYFDHPKFGLFAIITPYDLPEQSDILDVDVIPLDIPDDHEGASLGNAPALSEEETRL